MIYNYCIKTLQLGYTWYGAAFQGTGIGTKHCKFLLLEFALKNWEWKELSSGPTIKNQRSIAANEKYWMYGRRCIEKQTI
jgi:RimJ/RimL family protein N-acetyltransferase